MLYVSAQPWKWDIVTYVAEKACEWQAVISGKCKHLPRTGRDIADSAAECQNGDDAAHDSGSSVRSGRVIKCPDKSEEIGRRDGVLKRTQAVGERDHHDQSRDAV